MAGIELGYRYETDPIPPVPEDTTYYPVSALSVGVEYRHLTDDILDDNYSKDDRQSAIINAARPAMIDDEGVSLHVCDGQTGAEHLRFDLFVNEPHYHYIMPGLNIVIPYDAAALGDMLTWAVGCIRTRLQPMLEYCGASDLWKRVNQERLEAELPAVAAAARVAVAT